MRRLINTVNVQLLPFVILSYKRMVTHYNDVVRDGVGTDITKSFWNTNILKSLFYRSCLQCGVRSIRTGKLYLKEVGCQSCHSTFSVHIVAKMVLALFVFVGIRLTFVLIPTFGIIGSILFCYLLVMGIEYLLFRYSPLKTRSRNEGRRGLIL